MINAISTSVVNRPEPVVSSTPDGNVRVPAKVVAPASIELSALSRQLNESAERAKASYEGLDHKQLRSKANTIWRQFSNENYYFKKSIHDKEIPATDDPELLARARLATQFVTQNIYGSGGAKSPFAGLSLDQLTLIGYDDKGPYTRNERLAALSEAGRLQELASVAHLNKYAETSGSPEDYQEQLEYYRSLPPILQAQRPEGIEERLEDWIRQAGGEPEKPQRLLNLFEVLAGLRLRKPKEDEEEQPEEAIKAPPAIKTNNLSPDACPTPADARRNSPSPVVPRTDG